jgi:hypothetical protein
MLAPVRSVFENLHQLPTLQAAQRPGFFNPDQIANRAPVLRIVRIQFFRPFRNLAKFGVGYPANHGDHDGLLHFIGHDLADSGFSKMPLLNPVLLPAWDAFRQRLLGG